MMSWEWVLASPYLQLAWICVLSVLCLMFMKRSGGFVLASVFMSILIWIMVSTAYGVVSSQPWIYLVHMLAATLLSMPVFMITGYLVTKFGKKDYNDEGFIMVLGVPAVYAFTFVFFLPVKALMVFFSWLLA